MRKFGVLVLLLMLFATANAQQESATKREIQEDSIKEARTDMAALMYPRLRQFTITHQENATGDIKSKLHGDDFFKGRFRSSRTTINFNLPIIEKPKNMLIGSLGVVHQFFYLNDVENENPSYTASNTDTYVPMLNLGLSYTHRDSLFNIPYSITIGANALFDPPMERYQFTYLGLVTVPIIRRAGTSLIVGMAINIDPSSPAPAIPFISYLHHFGSANMDLMIDLPYRFALRKPVNKVSFTFLTELAGSNSFFKFENADPTLPSKMTYSVLELKSGLLFEYKVTRKLIFSLSGGVTSTIKSRILEQGVSPNDYIIDNTIQPVPYGQVGLSMLPFWRPFMPN